MRLYHTWRFSCYCGDQLNCGCDPERSSRSRESLNPERSSRYRETPGPGRSCSGNQLVLCSAVRALVICPAGVLRLCICFFSRIISSLCLRSHPVGLQKMQTFHVMCSYTEIEVSSEHSHFCLLLHRESNPDPLARKARALTIRPWGRSFKNCKTVSGRERVTNRPTT